MPVLESREDDGLHIFRNNLTDCSERNLFYSVSARGPLSVSISWLGTLRLLVKDSYLLLIGRRSTKGRVYICISATSRFVTNYDLMFTRPE